VRNRGSTVLRKALSPAFRYCQLILDLVDTADPPDVGLGRSSHFFALDHSEKANLAVVDLDLNSGRIHAKFTTRSSSQRMSASGVEYVNDGFLTSCSTRSANNNAT